MSLYSYFQVSPEMFDQVQVQAPAGQLKDIQRLVPKPLLLVVDDMDAVTTMLHRRDGARYPLGVTLGIPDKEFNLGSIKPENLVSHGLTVL